MKQSRLTPVSSTAAWRTLEESAAQARKLSIAELFEADPGRAEDFRIEAAGLYLDYSRHLLRREDRQRLLALGEAQGLPAAIEAMFRGEAINNTEQRPALHVALRSPVNDSAETAAVHECLAQMTRFVEALRSGTWRGHDGRPIRQIVNIGIGGSDLGPRMAYQALRPYHNGQLRCHFVSNVDPCHLSQTLATLDPGETLFIVASKSFTTQETSANAAAARQWLLDSGVAEAELSRHLAAVSSNVGAAHAFGIAPANIFPLWDWVGGRYSLWSAIGLPIALGTDMNIFRALLQGGHTMDCHFREAPLDANLPVHLALLSLWYQQFLGTRSHVVLPYLQDLALFPSFLQQLDMESLGKSVRLDGSTLDIPSGSVLWGSAGTNGQHSFHQLLHQGTQMIPADFIAAARSHDDQARHEQLLANCLAQGRALMTGKSLAQAREELIQTGYPPEEAERLAPHLQVPGNRPSSTLMMEALTPETLGALIGAYEHKVYVYSVLTQINAFDQWGVELGKALSKAIQPRLAGGTAATFDPSTEALLRYCAQKR